MLVCFIKKARQLRLLEIQLRPIEAPRVFITLQSTSTPLIYQNVMINHVNRNALIDTGSQISIMARQALTAGEINLMSLQNDVLITMGGQVRTVGKINAIITVYGMTVSTTITIVDTPLSPIIIGMDVIYRLGNAVVHPICGIIPGVPFNTYAPTTQSTINSHIVNQSSNENSATPRPPSSLNQETNDTLTTPFSPTSLPENWLSPPIPIIQPPHIPTPEPHLRPNNHSEYNPIQGNEISSTTEDPLDNLTRALHAITEESEDSDETLNDRVTNFDIIFIDITEVSTEGWTISIFLTRPIGYTSTANVQLRLNTAYQSLTIIQLIRNKIVVLIPIDLPVNNSCIIVVNIDGISRDFPLSLSEIETE